ncbi:MAG: arsenate reductase family protein [Steroidobacteraceae bacterium]|nr:arsenate reductase family protein [Deltaproteobacteria bacterium]
MALVTFFTKLGCSTSAKQVDLLKQSGHEVEVIDLLSQSWTGEQLITFFGGMPIKKCFNPNSPRVKSGEIDPAAYSQEEALKLMLEDHLLIRRPLMESEGKRLCGFDPVTVNAWVGLEADVLEQSAKEDYASCSQTPASSQPCR